MCSVTETVREARDYVRAFLVLGELWYDGAVHHVPYMMHLLSKAWRELGFRHF